MLNIRSPWIGYLLTVVATALAGCTPPKTNVSATGNVPAQYAHVYMSVQEIWFNTSATALPDDTTWAKFPLTTPVMIDLAASVDGTLNSITTGLNVPVGTYAQARLIPVDSGAALISSPVSGAKYNFEVDYTDSSNTLQQVPLELQNPEKGIGVTTSIQIKASTSSAFGSSNSSSNNSSSSNSSSSNGSSIYGTSNSSTSSSSTSNSSSSSSSQSTAPFLLAINVDGAKDLVPFTYISNVNGTSSNVNGMLLNPHVTAYDGAAVGAIQGTLDITSLTGISSPSTTSYVNIQVTAESLSADGSRHIAVNSAPVTSSGTFTLYPLSTTSSSPTSYDLVVHGPGIATIIVKGVTVNVGDPATTTPVNIGSITPRAATSYKVNLTTTTPLQAGALVGFYQTLPGSSEVPYLIEEQPIDPFNRTFATDQAVSAGSIDYGTFTSGSTVSLTTNDPTEGTSTYRVAASAPLFADGVLTTTVTGSGGSTTTTLLTVPTLAAATGAALDSTQITIGQTTPGKYDKGEIILSHDGAIIATASLDSILAQSASATLTIPGVPGGSSAGQFQSALYYVSVRTWNSTTVATTGVNREVYPTPLDLRTGGVSTYTLKID